MMRHLFTAVVAMVAMSATAQTFQPEFSKPRKAYLETMAVPNHADSRYELGLQRRHLLTHFGVDSVECHHGT